MRRRRVAQVAVGAVLLAALGLGAVLAAQANAGRLAGSASGAPAGVEPAGPQAQAAGQDAVAAPPVPGSGSAPVIPLPPAQAGRDVVRTAKLAVDVGDPGSAAASVRDLATGSGGLVADETVRDRAAELTVRVPADRLDGLLAGLARLGTPTERSVQAEDVTERVVDLETRLATQRASVARVRALLERATTIGQIVEIESELARREADLESLQARAAALGSQVAMSTVHVELRAVGAAAGGGGFLDGLAGGWGAFITAARGLLVVLGAALPFLGLAVLVGATAIAVRRRLRARRAAAG